MKLSERWLRDWVSPQLAHDDIRNGLTMAGLEVEDVQPVAEKFFGVVVANVLRVEKHPEADRLHVCEVDVGGPEILTIVCGAKNVTAGMKTAAALEGAILANKIKIKTSKLRGVVSRGMLCSPVELGLAEEGEGLIVFPPDAPVGKDAWEYLDLADYVMDISITPNRGDCLSILGLAQDISAITRTETRIPTVPNVDAVISDTLPVTIHAAEACPHYVGRVIRQVAADATTPIWLQERLRRAGQRCISPVVDVMNYVMLELGQPMHAFDLSTLSGGIEIRMAKPDESLELLDAQTVELEPNTLIIADDKKPLAIAGVMGGLKSSVTLLTKDIFLESAFFQPKNILQATRYYKLNSESSYRFERGIDPELQVRAIERATQLILEIAGGQPGPVIDIAKTNYIPQKKDISLRVTRVKDILGFVIPENEIEKILQCLGFLTEKNSTGWKVTVPPRRSDIDTEIDLIEEVVRIYGYDKVPQRPSVSHMQMPLRPEKKIHLSTIRRTLVDMGYQEIIAYSFIDKKIQQCFNPDLTPRELLNPITTDMSVMRTSLWPGLINTLIYNQNRQQTRVRIFETGLRFIVKDGSLEQQNVLSGLVSGKIFPEQWGIPPREVDFFDVKGDMENLLALTLDGDEIEFKKGDHPALHPGQMADIYRSGEYLGTLGVLHPKLTQEFGLTDRVVLFEMQLDRLETAKLPYFKQISKFPEIRRDVAIVVDQAIPVSLIQDTITYVANELLQSINVFDVYQGKGITEGRKSVALSLTLQHASRTLVDEEVTALMERVILALQEKFAAELRG